MWFETVTTFQLLKKHIVHHKQKQTMSSTSSSSTFGLPKLHFPPTFTKKISFSPLGLRRKPRVSSITTKTKRINSICSCLIDSGELIAPKVKVETWYYYLFSFYMSLCNCVIGLNWQHGINIL